MWLYESINWREFEKHAGPEDLGVPELLEGVLGDTGESREASCVTLWQWPYELLDRYGRLSALPFVVDCLVDFARNQELHLSTLLAQIESYWHSAIGCCFRKEFYSGSRISWLNSMRKAVARGTDVYVKHLTHSDPAVRLAATGIASQFSSLYSRMVDSVESESDPAVGKEMIRSISAMSYGRLPALTASVRDSIIAQPTSKGIEALHTQPLPNDPMIWLAEVAYTKWGDSIGKDAFQAIAAMPEDAMLIAILYWLDRLENVDEPPELNRWHEIGLALIHCVRTREMWFRPSELWLDPRLRYFADAWSRADAYWRGTNDERALHRILVSHFQLTPPTRKALAMSTRSPDILDR